MSVSKDSPWLLFDVNLTNDFSVNLFEYKNGVWKFVKNFSSNEESDEFIQREYKLR